MASLTDPSDALANKSKASSDIFPFSILDIFFRWSEIICKLTLFKSNLWHLDKTVIGIFLSSVVAI